MVEKCDATLSALIQKYGETNFFNKNVVYDDQANSCEITNKALKELRANDLLDPRKTLPCDAAVKKIDITASEDHYIQAPIIPSCGGGNGGPGGGGSGPGGGGPGG